MAEATDKLLSRRDVQFCLHDWLNIGETTDAETVDAIIDLSARLAEEHFLSHYKASDTHEPSLDADGVHILPQIGEALGHYADAGLFAAGFAEELGGFDLPFLACAASFAHFAAANVATAAYPMLTAANARLIAAFGSPAQVEAFARPQIAGEWFGTMCLSEPQAGSSLAEIRTRAQPDGEDELGQRYRLQGNKMWISGGDQDVSGNIVHLVLAKVPGIDGKLPDGTAGLSLFIAPKILPDGARNDVSVAGLNHKMGYRGTANCLLNFGENNGAIGWLVGQPGEGLRQMFMMMNEARISVGLGAAALGYRSYLLSLQYAQERLQGRPMGVRDGEPVAIIHHPDVRRMLLSQKAYAEGSLALCLYCAKLVDAHGDPDSTALLDLLTPIAKTWPSEYGLAANDIAIQIHGGYGYTREFHVEQLWRDNRLNPIHEGTTGIQAMDLLGRKILRDGSALPLLKAKLEAAAKRAESIEELRGLAPSMLQAWSAIEACLQQLSDRPAERAFDNATPFLWAFGHVVLGWIWLEQAVTAARLDRSAETQAHFAEGKIRACRHFFDSELPKVAAWLCAVEAGSDTAATAPIETF
ncbi:acyl-CoA dehydrogenase [Alteraurantiacibacter aquimixticola]|uniref:Acyl-CoA dehydrogenase n=1 Tax=Alteraurantiacibacter aquimixticola TaxID=2489173 RepID=A0A4T3F5P5_9SPHN|nr:acyl-CoA dehydrogenase [Alteraurantiacibacter aquimixticola]TIX51714.1 acyl-CoA dehydrogenase [Alteraurantiacibacter aquimixticola]